MSYDDWRTRVPDWPSGQGGLSLEATFWRAFRFAQRNACVEEFLSIQRHHPSFAALVDAAEQITMSQHTCDESCRCCAQCYCDRGLEVCSKACDHRADAA